MEKKESKDLEGGKRERAPDAECEPTCSDWNDDSKVSKLKADRSITGYQLMPTCDRENLNKKMKRSPDLRDDLGSSQFKRVFQEHWGSNSKLCDNGTELIVHPFKVCIIENLLDNPIFLNEVRNEFNELDWNMRSMDLYEFAQSCDLKYINLEHMSSMYKFLATELRIYISELTGFELTHISATCCFYTKTDFLLVHDDQREDRRVAFILYLHDSWEEDWGGALQLLDKDQNNQPHEVVRSITPKFNQFVFFPVANDSYHQVSEVVASRCRMSINGWFHTATPPTFETPLFTALDSGLYGTVKHSSAEFDGDLDTWIRPNYLATENTDEIQVYFEDHSEVCLKEFFRSAPMRSLLEAFTCSTLNWIRVGPPNRFNYEVLDCQNLPIVLERLVRLFKSEQMFELLAQYSALALGKDKGTMKFEIQRWSPGSYALLGDYKWMESKELDVIINFGCPRTTDVVGGRIMYVTLEDEIQNALITIDPHENSLNLVFRDTARFTSHVSRMSRCKTYYSLICSYAE